MISAELKEKLAHPLEDMGALGVGEKKKMTPAEKIASVHIDFDRDNILPELNEEDLPKIDVETNKPVLLKKSIIDRNAVEHADLSDSEFQPIVAHALYAPSEVFPANRDKPYFHFTKIIRYSSKGSPQFGFVLLDIDDRHDYFEVVHAHFVRERSFKAMKNKQ